METGSAVADFDLIAGHYRTLEYLSFGSYLQRTRTYFLPALTDCRQALLLGDGDGRFLAELFTYNRLVCADAVDTSSAMLMLLRRRAEALLCLQEINPRTGDTLASGKRRLHTYQRDALEYVPNRAPDLITSHFFLDCLTQSQVERLIRGLAPSMAPNGLWLVSDFCIPNGRMRVLGTIYVRLLYFAFRLLTGLRVTRLPDHASVFRTLGFVRVGYHERLFGLLVSELWQAGG